MHRYSKVYHAARLYRAAHPSVPAGRALMIVLKEGHTDLFDSLVESGLDCTDNDQTTYGQAWVEIARLTGWGQHATVSV